MVLGHEAAGIVDKLGPGVTHLQDSDSSTFLLHKVPLSKK
jgi:Zn-dependent alcohol dehydrogenase